MFLIRFFVGVLLVLLGMAYLFEPKSVLRINAFMREKVFQDSHVLLSSRRIGASLLAVGVLLLLVSVRFSR